MISNTETAFQIMLHCIVATLGFILLATAHPNINHIMILIMTTLYVLMWGMVAFTLYANILIDFHYRYFRGHPVPLINSNTRDLLYSRGVYGYGINVNYT